MTKADSEYLTVGKIGATFGVRGWLKVYSYTEFQANIVDYQPWYLSASGSEWTAVTLEDSRLHGDGLIIKLQHVNSPEEARLYTGQFIAIQRSQLPKLHPNEYYWSELEGLTVINQAGEVLGTVSYLIETGSNDVLVIKNDKEYAIPYLPGSVILKVDLEKKEIHVNWELF
jgi:16S rRNA processing protein RimM